MESLFKITEEQMRLNAMLEESGGELTPEIEAALAINEDNFAVKAQNYVFAIGDYAMIESRCAEEIARLSKIKKVASNAQERMKESIATAMHAFGRDKFVADTYTISFRKSEQVIIDDEQKIPSLYVKVATSIDKTALKSALKSGTAIAGAHLQTNSNLQIR